MIRLLKLLSALVLVAALGWIGWWVIGARGQEAAIEAWFDARAAEGWQAETASVAVTGFPATFHRRIDAPALADPDAGWAWQAPFLVLESPANDPTAVTMRFPDAQSFSTRAGRADVVSQRMEAALALRPVPALTLRHGGLTAEGLALTGANGWQAGAQRVDIRLEARTHQGEPENTHSLSGAAGGVSLPAALRDRLDPGGILSPLIQSVDLEAIVVPDRPLDRQVLEDGGAGLQTLVLRRAALDWDKVGFSAQGRLDADAEGRAEGSVELSLRDWRRLVSIARNAGVLPEELVGAVEGALEFVALLNRSETLDLTLTFAGGRARIGPIPVGAAPRMRAVQRQ